MAQILGHLPPTRWSSYILTLAPAIEEPAEKNQQREPAEKKVSISSSLYHSNFKKRLIRIKKLGRLGKEGDMEPTRCCSTKVKLKAYHKNEPN